MQHYERIVIGVGGIGSAVLYHLARRGVRTLGIEQFTVAHDRGSSHGQTRIIRQAYFEHPRYVPLLLRADALWCELEVEAGESLFRRVGLIEVGSPDGVLMNGVALSAQTHGLPIEKLSAADVRRRFPAFLVPNGMEVVFEPTAGLLYVERCVEAHVQQARRAGAAVVEGQTVQEISDAGGHFIVRTEMDDYLCDGVVICGGPWSPALPLNDLPLRIVRKHLHWFATHDSAMQLERDCPVFFYELPHGCFYGFPAIDARGVKLSEHSGGQTMVDPITVDCTADPIDDGRIRRFRQQCLPAVTDDRLGHAVCMYTLTPDEHFIVDRHPQCEGVVFAAGLSGHGFKFAPVLGEILSELSLEGRTSWDIGFLSASRFECD